MRNFEVAGAIVLSLWGADVTAAEQARAGFGPMEFGMTQKQLTESIEKVEQLISSCMRDQGFEYYAADYETVHAGMKTDKHVRGLTEEDFISKYGFGVATMYTGQPPQLDTGSPTQVGLGERNVQVFKGLPPPAQAAYNRALFGEGGLSFAMALETENLSATGGCTRKSVEQEIGRAHV